MIEKNLIIEEDNLSIAWSRVFLRLMEHGVSGIRQLIVTINGFQNGNPIEDRMIRDTLDTHLKRNGEFRVNTTANTIFPQSQWNPDMDRNHLYERYLKIAPRLKRFDTHNKYGLYFQRLIAFGSQRSRHAKGFNQIEHIISTYRKGNHRPSALQASTLDPLIDHTDQRQRGFPCLQQVAFIPYPDNKSLSITGFYPTQYIFDRAYGNYLGLARLGHFVAHELGLELSQVNCIASKATLGSCTKQTLRPLASEIDELLSKSLNGLEN